MRWFVSAYFFLKTHRIFYKKVGQSFAEQESPDFVASNANKSLGLCIRIYDESTYYWRDVLKQWISNDSLFN